MSEFAFLAEVAGAECDREGNLRATKEIGIQHRKLMHAATRQVREDGGTERSVILTTIVLPTCTYEENPSSSGSAKPFVSPLEIRTPIVRSFVNADNQADICVYERKGSAELGIPCAHVAANNFFLAMEKRNCPSSFLPKPCTTLLLVRTFIFWGLSRPLLPTARGAK